MRNYISTDAGKFCSLGIQGRKMPIVCSGYQSCVSLVPYKHNFWNSKQFIHVDIACLNNTAVGWLTWNEVENTVKIALLLPGPCHTSFQCCIMPCWFGSRYKAAPGAFAQNSCWMYFSFLSLHETPVMTLITLKLLSSIVMSTGLKFNFTWMFLPCPYPRKPQPHTTYTMKNHCVSYLILEKHKSKFPLIV